MCERVSALKQFVTNQQQYITNQAAMTAFNMVKEAYTIAEKSNNVAKMPLYERKLNEAMGLPVNPDLPNTIGV